MEKCRDVQRLRLGTSLAIIRQRYKPRVMGGQTKFNKSYHLKSCLLSAEPEESGVDDDQHRKRPRTVLATRDLETNARLVQVS